MNIIKGFSDKMGYSCKECKAYCCKSEYKLPLFEFEKDFIEKNYSFVHHLILPNNENTKSTDYLHRGNKCIFLDDNSLCRIHKDFSINNKPLTCQVYPFILIKLNNQDRFVYIYPCKGMKWVSKKEDRINFQIFKKFVIDIDDTYNSIFADEIDGYNS